MNKMVNSLISFPRSGNTLLRYLLEYITNRTVADTNPDIPDSAIQYLNPGSIVVKKDFILVKSHTWKESLEDNGCNLLLRNYNDCIYSHNKRTPNMNPPQLIRQYCDLIKKFDSHDKKVLVIYYEDLLNMDKQPEILYEILTKNGVESFERWEEYKSNKVELNGKSRNGYKKVYKFLASESKGDRPDYTNDVRKELGDRLFNKYLSRYEK